MGDAAAGDMPWWAAGLKFRCTACGRCCTGEPGHVWVLPEEIERMAKARGLAPKVFKRRFVRRVGKRLSLREQDGGDCVMLEEKRCRVYAAKPLRCTTFPFWEEVLVSAEEWEETAERCEGIGQGDRYGCEEIERLLSGDATPLLEKHERPAEGPVHSRYVELPDEPAPAPGVDAGAEPDWAAAFTALEELYARLDAELPRYEFTCSASGRCCDFDAHGHRLYASTLEAEQFFRHASARRSNEDPRLCPVWGADRLCQARRGRMLGCRTYFCPPYPNGLPEDLYERYHGRIRALHDRFGIPFAYRDLVEWAAERRPADSGPTGA